jgi:hypothetical protein
VVKVQQVARPGIAGKIKARGGGDARTSLTTSNAKIGWAAARTQIPQYLGAQRVPAAQGHLLRWRSSTISPHHLRRAAWHLPLRRSEHGLLYFHHGLLGVVSEKRKGEYKYAEVFGSID